MQILQMVASLRSWVARANWVLARQRADGVDFSRNGDARNHSGPAANSFGVLPFREL